eukprot:gb/GFBE01008271.1/.p1 GENE.gb/GFBE01008271.1/~~gb/GFBE01008271.1/.p1  ORF type:complete len:345 (+),score=62.29 gb/GFBE01008271.1/:1-1035(+)
MLYSSSPADAAAMKKRNPTTRQLMKATRLCKFHLSGVCARGEACNFAHSQSQLVAAPDLKKTRFCVSVFSGLPCPDGPGCTYAHDESELRNGDEMDEAAVPAWPGKPVLATQPVLQEPVQSQHVQQWTQQPQMTKMIVHKTKMCKFFLEGGCQRGAACTFAHSSSELKEKPNLEKTGLCISWMTNRTCRIGAQCKFAHSLEEKQPDPRFHNNHQVATAPSPSVPTHAIVQRHRARGIQAKATISRVSTTDDSGMLPDDCLRYPSSSLESEQVAAAPLTEASNLQMTMMAKDLPELPDSELLVLLQQSAVRKNTFIHMPQEVACLAQVPPRRATSLPPRLERGEV